MDYYDNAHYTDQVVLAPANLSWIKFASNGDFSGRNMHWLRLPIHCQKYQNTFSCNILLMQKQPVAKNIPLYNVLSLFPWQLFNGDNVILQ